MSVSVIIELEHSGGSDMPPPDLDPDEKYVYGQGFDTTWSILDYIAELNGWQPLSSFCVGEDIDYGEEESDEKANRTFRPVV